MSLHLKLYLDEFTRVIFRKENLQSNRAWWLSAFYSLCIQAYVRILLISIANGLSDESGGSDIQAPTRYLHLVVKLFLASSAGYDPIVSDYSGNLIESKEFDHFKIAQVAVGQSIWTTRSINSSRDYLFYLFKIDERLDVEEEESDREMADHTHQTVGSWTNLTSDSLSREPQKSMASPSLGGLTAVASVLGGKTGFETGPVLWSHPRLLTMKDLHLQLENEQEAVVRGLLSKATHRADLIFRSVVSKENCLYSLRSASVVSNSSSSSMCFLETGD